MPAASVARVPVLWLPAPVRSSTQVCTPAGLGLAAPAPCAKRPGVWGASSPQVPPRPSTPGPEFPPFAQHHCQSASWEMLMGSEQQDPGACTSQQLWGRGARLPVNSRPSSWLPRNVTGRTHTAQHTEDTFFDPLAIELRGRKRAV